MIDIFAAHRISDPPLLLAPMEGITNPIFRQAIVELGGASLVATEFVRITAANQRVKPFVRHTVPLQIQLMGTNSEVLAGSVRFLKARQLLSDDDWLDLNVGCPSRRVNSHGAGAKLLETPDVLLQIIETLRREHSGPLSIKTRLGFSCTGGYELLLRRLREAPLDFITIHARTRDDGYQGAARWEYLRAAVEELPYPVIGNGDVVHPAHARELLQVSGVRGIMCGRGVLRDPFLLRDIRAELTGNAPEPAEKRGGDLLDFALRLLSRYLEKGPRTMLGPYKEFLGFLRRNPLFPARIFDSAKRCGSLDEIVPILKDHSEDANLPSEHTEKIF